MLITRNITINPYTVESAPLVTNIALTSKRLQRVFIYFPNGCYGAVGVKLYDNGLQFAPQGSGWIRSNDNMITWAEGRRMSDGLLLTVEAINEAIDYPHTVNLYLEFI